MRFLSFSYIWLSKNIFYRFCRREKNRRQNFSISLSQPCPAGLCSLRRNWEQSCSKGAEDMTFVTLSAPIENGTVFVRKRGQIFSAAVAAFIESCKR